MAFLEAFTLDFPCRQVAVIVFTNFTQGESRETTVRYIRANIVHYVKIVFILSCNAQKNGK
jgi:hypothetical protein